MGMTCTLRRVSEADLQQLAADPTFLRTLLDINESSAPEVEVVRPKGLLGLLLRLTPITITQVKPLPESEADDLLSRYPPNPDELDLDKTWHGLHFLFTGTEWEGDEPACFLVKGGEDVGDEELEYDLVRAFSPDRVRSISDFLASLSREELERRYDPVQMTKLKIYPDAVWARPATAEHSELTYLLDSYAELRDFVGETATNGKGLLVYLG